MRKIIRAVAILLSLSSVFAFGGVAYGDFLIRDKLCVVDRRDVFLPPLYSGVLSVEAVNAVDTEDGTLSYDIRLLNSVYVKKVEIENTDRKYVTPLGSAFGIKIYTDGVIVVKTDAVSTKDGFVSPAQKAGIRQGDIILEIDGKKVMTNREVSELFVKSKGVSMSVNVKRESAVFTTELKTVYSETDGRYRAGIWVRDSSAGIGTLTCYDDDSGMFCGLGHAVCDVDTGQVLSLSDGEAVDAVIKGSYKSKAGNPGELCGVFGDYSIGRLTSNSRTGVYGISDSITSSFDETPVAMHYEVQEGDAYIISEINENGPQKFDAKIIRLFGNSDSQEKNLVIEITDEDLINETGGIVQGMSGSPIIQNGMLVGAVTHVLVNDPTKGYGIFAENMLDTVK